MDFYTIMLILAGLYSIIEGLRIMKKSDIDLSEIQEFNLVFFTIVRDSHMLKFTGRLMRNFGFLIILVSLVGIYVDKGGSLIFLGIALFVLVAYLVPNYIIFLKNYCKLNK